MPDQGRIHRFFTPDLPDTLPSRVHLPADEAHHARTVLRLAPGSAVELFDGRGTVGRGTLASVARQGVTVDLDSKDSRPRPRPLVHVAFAAPKPKRLDWLLEKATELAAASLGAVIFERSVAGARSLTDSKLRRWHARCLAAAKQSGLNVLPELRTTLTVGEYLAIERPPGDLRLLGDPAEDAAPLADAAACPPAADNIHLLIGPEGGLGERERAAALAAGFVPVRLGTTTLRIETAAVAILAALVAICEP